MKARMKVFLTSMALVVAIMGGNMTVNAAVECLEEGHVFSVTYTMIDSDIVNTHKHTDAATGLSYTCRLYRYYFSITQHCHRCGGNITLSDIVTKELHIAQ